MAAQAVPHILKAKKNDRPIMRDIVNFVVPDVRHKWYDIGLQLLHPRDEALLQSLKLQYSSTSDKCREVFRRWLDVNTKATWSKIIKALNKRSVDLRNVSYKIESMLDKRGLIKRGTHKISKILKENQSIPLPSIAESHPTSSSDTDVERSQQFIDEDAYDYSSSNTDGSDQGSDNESLGHIFSSSSHPGTVGGLQTTSHRRRHTTSVSDNISTHSRLSRPYHSVPAKLDRMDRQQAGSTGSLDIPGSNFIDSTELTHSENILSQMSPTISPRHQRAGSFSTHSSNTTTTESIQQEKVDREIQDLYQQSKLEVERLTKKNKSQVESIEKLQSECNKLKSQVKEFERIKERNGLLKETLDNTNEENQKLKQEVIVAKVEVSSLNEKLAAKVESEKVLQEAKIKLEENLQTMQAKRENLTIQLESTKVKLESKLEKINSIETQSKELHKQVNELRLKVSQQQTQIQVEQTIQEKEQQKHDELQCLVQEISSLKESLKQLQESFSTLNVKEATTSALNISLDGAKTSAYGADCTKEDLIEIIEVHINQIVELHQQMYMYKREIYSKS